MFKSNVFDVRRVVMAGTQEQIVLGGRYKFDAAAAAFHKSGIKQIGVIGWGSQGPAQAQNLRDSLAGTSVRIKVGLQEGSRSVTKANQAGFTAENGTLGEMWDVVAKSDLVLLLISDAAQVQHYDRIFRDMKVGATLGLSHGFLLGHMRNAREKFPGHMNVIGVCPKGMGPSVRRLYEQGKKVNGAGINCSFAVEQDISGTATDIALAWAIAIGAPFVFETTLRQEYLSDLVGERAVLLGAVHGIVESLYRFFQEAGMLAHQAFEASVENITGVLSPIVSKKGIIGVYNRLAANDEQRLCFRRAYCAAYGPYYALMQEIYDEVLSGNEIRSVILAGQRLEQFPMGEIDKTLMWRIGNEVRAQRNGKVATPNPITTGLYCAAMMAQIDTLRQRGHCWSEICNETVIEAVDSLNPFMHARGVSYMVDNCSTTARLGTRKWGPRWDHITMQLVLPQVFVTETNSGKMSDFLDHPVHDALRVCAEMRPPVDISVTG